MKTTPLLHAALAAAISLGAFATAQAQGAPDGGPPPHGERHAPQPLTRADALKRAGEMFDAADTNHDGVVTPEEMRAAHEKRAEEFARQAPEHGHPGMTPPPHEGGRDGEGRPAPKAVTRAEALARAAARFDAADTNHDGILSFEEMKAAHKPHGGPDSPPQH